TGGGRSFRSRSLMWFRGRGSVKWLKTGRIPIDSLDHSHRTLQEFFSQLRWPEDKLRERLQEIVRTQHAGATAIGLIDETSDVKEGDKTPRGETAVVRRRRQERGLHRDGPLGLGPQRLSLPARQRTVLARGLVAGSRALPSGRHPRCHDLPAQVADRPGTL